MYLRFKNLPFLEKREKGKRKQAYGDPLREGDFDLNLIEKTWDPFAGRSDYLFSPLHFISQSDFFVLIKGAALTAQRKKKNTIPLPSMTEQIQPRHQYPLYRSITVSRVYSEVMTPRAGSYAAMLHSAVQPSVSILYLSAGYKLWQCCTSSSATPAAQGSGCKSLPVGSTQTRRICTGLGTAGLRQPAMWAKNQPGGGDFL